MIEGLYFRLFCIKNAEVSSLEEPLRGVSYECPQHMFYVYTWKFVLISGPGLLTIRKKSLCMYVT